MKKCELLSPAGDMDSAYAAIHYGADAIYMGMKKFSARAEAENFTPDILSEITAFAHSSIPRRKIFVTVNTLILNHEIPELIETLAVISDIGVDAIIVQDLGVVHIVSKYFPNLTLHGSTQLAIHNLAGAKTLSQLGFRRVTLARELTIGEIRKIAAEAGIEVEVFLHGALCYSYSGLCLYSSMLRGRSGNRGRCNYPCRDSFSSDIHTKSFPFSMKDIALPDDLLPLREAGVISFKIEGRKKSPLYVAATTSYYRKLIDGKISKNDRKQYDDDIKTIFSRPWTNLYVRSENNADTADTETVGHRGAPIGRVERVINPNSRNAKLQFKTERPLERHDGLQIDLPGRPFGFPIDTLYLMPQNGKGQSKTVFEAPAGSTVQVILPQDHPHLPKGSIIYCSSSQAVKRRYKFIKPKPGEFRVRKNITVDVSLNKTNITATAAEGPIHVSSEVKGIFEKGKNIEEMEKTVKKVFEKLGDTCFSLKDFSFKNPEKLFAPVSLLNRLRRDVLSSLKSQIEQQQAATFIEYKEALKPVLNQERKTEISWSIKTDSLSNLSSFTVSDWKDVCELVIDIGNEPLSSLMKALHDYSDLIGKDNIRLALPVITRARDEKSLLEKITKFQHEGWTRWEAANLSAWPFLGFSASETKSLPFSSDWSVYVLNRAAALQVMDMGACRFTLSPEDGFDNMASLLKEFGEKATIILYQDTPLFISETCAFANITGKCTGKNDCITGELPLVSGKKERILLITRNCRTIVINEHPYCIANNIKKLLAAGATHFRADFIYRRHNPAKVLEIWHALRTGKNLPASYEANISATLL
ncbi:MAG: U32 family peptidase [Kiritimatiellae bacterium]|nr:U32 family peptidase [Kiritimatiellia bacterium]MDD5521063.1 U32 family peptidase [Kiritimatiellia bacterium]